MILGDFALLGLEAENGATRLWEGWGPFAPSRRPAADRCSFYVQDFFRGDLHPWKLPTESREILLPQPTSLPAVLFPVEWEPLFAGPFADACLSLQARIHDGELRKGVPVVFEEGRVGDPQALWEQAATALRNLPRPLHAYAWSDAGTGFFGASPELLFRAHRENSRWVVRTMALAGTAPKGRGDELLNDAKELHEHALVVEDVLREMRGWGAVERGETCVHRLPTLEHLRTDIEVRLSDDPAPGELFERLVRRLHPTSALGAAPRSDVATRWMRDADLGVNRGSFGAPFGAIAPTGEMICLVGIRQVQLTAHGRVRLGAGCGVVEQSRWPKEWRELALKRRSVKTLFGLADA